MQITDFEQCQSRQHLLTCGGRVRFVGAKKYGELQAYARSIDVALLPYRKSEPTYSGSSTRFYEHLAACRPILATRGFEELLHKDPLLRLADSDEEMTAALEELRKVDFHDGREELRRHASQTETWELRARQMRHSLVARLEAERAGDRRIANPVLAKSTASASIL
jgi:glycosyltransferase involved in cell wall biosynthesis